MKIKFFIILVISVVLFFFFFTERNIKFDKQIWNDPSKNTQSGYFINKKRMVNDIMENHLYHGMLYNDLVNLLGEPSNNVHWQRDAKGDLQPNQIIYEIEVYYGWNIDPQRITHLLIDLSDDSKIIDFKLVTWNEGEN